MTDIGISDEIVELVKGAIQTDMNTDNTDEATTDATSEDIVTAESTSQRSLAIATVRQKRVYHVPEAGTCLMVFPSNQLTVLSMNSCFLQYCLSLLSTDHKCLNLLISNG
jgi:hypothetical protein